MFTFIFKFTLHYFYIYNPLSPLSNLDQSHTFTLYISLQEANLWIKQMYQKSGNFYTKQHICQDSDKLPNNPEDFKMVTPVL